MSYPLEEKLPYPWLALLVLAMVNGIYFAKMLVQHRHGIRTNQIGRRKESSMQALSRTTRSRTSTHSCGSG